MIDIESITDKDEMKKLALDEYGLVLSNTMKIGTMRQKIYDHCAENGLAEPIAVREPPKPTAINKNEYVTINIQRSDKKNGGEPVPVNWNGRLYTIPRGKDIPVPPAVEEILNNAVKTVYSMPEDSDPDSEMVERDVLAYPYQIVAGHEHVIRFKRQREREAAVI